MPHKAKILITGGAGFIGSHINLLLKKEGYETVVLDDLRRGNAPCENLVKQSLQEPLDPIFEKHRFDGVIHLAASIQVGESVADPLPYYLNNVSGTLHLLEAMRKHHLDVMIFSSSAAIFGNPETPLIAEDHPKRPINPYGRTKLMIEEILEDCDRAYGLRSCCLRYFNAAGGDPGGKLKSSAISEQNVLPILLRSLSKGAFTLNGRDYETPDGTCVRDYIHVWDLARAHLLALEHLLSGAPSCRYNVGAGTGVSLQELINCVEKVTKHRVDVQEGARRPGDPPSLIANPSLAIKELGWQVNYSLEDMVAHAWRALTLLEK